MKLDEYGVRDAMSRSAWREALQILFCKFGLAQDDLASILIEEYFGEQATSIAYHNGHRIYSWIEGHGWNSPDVWLSPTPRAWIKVPYSNRYEASPLRNDSSIRR